MKTNILFTAFCICSSAFAAPGDLDLNFGNGGKVVTYVGQYIWNASQMAFRADGKIVVAGTAGAYSGGLVRYNSNGTLDTSFNGTGILGIKGTTDVAFQSDGKTVYVGYDSGSLASFATIGRRHTDGSIDTTFGTLVDVATGRRSGSQFATSTTQVAGASGVAIQSDGKIAIAMNEGGNWFSLWRCTTNGEYDTQFGGSGVVRIAVGTCYCVSIQSDGKIVAAGVSWSNDYIAVRYLPNGDLDTNFGGTGIVTVDLGGVDDIANCIALQSDGKILLGGTRAGAGGLTRINGNGTLDTSFNANGKVLTDIKIADVTLQSDGKIIVVGTLNDKFTVERFTTDGRLDSGFGIGGKVTTPLGGQIDQATSVAVQQSDGRIVVAGSTSLYVAVVRYEGGSFTPVQQWKLTQLGNADAPDLGDTDFDGLVHLTEYALNLSPIAPSLPPAVTRFPYAAGERLRMFFTRDPARNDVTIEVQAAGSPAGPWTTVAASTLGGVTTGPGYVGGDDASPGLKTVEVRDTVDISPTTASRYLRVKVTH